MENERIITLPENLDREWATSGAMYLKKRSEALVFDFSATRRIDSAALCLIRLLHRSYKRGNAKLVLRNISPELLATLRLIPDFPAPALRADQRKGILLQAGDALIAASEITASALSVLVEMLYWGTI